MGIELQTQQQVQEQEPQPYSAELDMIRETIQQALDRQANKYNVTPKEMQICIYPDEKLNPKYKSLVNWDVKETNMDYTDLMCIKVDFRGVALLLTIKMPSVFKRVCEKHKIEPMDLRIVFMYDMDKNIACMVYRGIQPISSMDIMEIYA